MNISSTVDQALRLLVHLAETPQQTPADLARDLDMNRTTVHRLLATLHGRGFVTRVDGAAVYSIGPTVLHMAESVGPNIRSVSRPVLEHLSATTTETVLLFAPEFAGRPPQAIAVDQVETRAHIVRVEFAIGHRIPLHQGAAAQAILAHAKPDVVDAALRNADDPDAVASALDRTRRLGYATTHDELLADVVGIAAPILDADGAPAGSVSVVAPSSRADRLDGMVPDMLAAVTTISELIRR